jgi:iron complex outermembrane receptor protein
MLQTHVESAYWLAVDHNTDPLKEIGSRQRGYTRSQSSVTYSTSEGRFSIQAWVRNIENKPVMTLFSYGGGGSAPYASISPPRTFGVTLAGRF